MTPVIINLNFNRLPRVAEPCLYGLDFSHQRFECKVNYNCSFAAAFTFISAENNAGIRLHEFKVMLPQQTNHRQTFIKNC